MGAIIKDKRCYNGEEPSILHVNKQGSYLYNYPVSILKFKWQVHTISAE
jgi:hypothetical protein